MNCYERYKESLFQQFERIGKALSSAKRLELLYLLSQGERRVELLAKETDTSIASTSQHLQVLKAARLVDAQKNGLFVTYRLADQSVADFLKTMCSFAENRLAEIEQITRELINEKELEVIDGDTLVKRMQEGDITILDVRPIEEYHAGHIPGALSIPLTELEERLAQLPRHQEIIAYCRGSYCVLSLKAAEMLKGHGYQVLRLKEGVNDWRAKGLPISVENSI